MCDYEIAAGALEDVVQEFSRLQSHDLSETDTKVKFVDRILRDCLGWPESGLAIRREEHVHQGFIDYTLRSGDNALILEAKREGQTFELPIGTTPSTRQTVHNTLLKQPDMRAGYDQVTR